LVPSITELFNRPLSKKKDLVDIQHHPPDSRCFSLLLNPLSVVTQRKRDHRDVICNGLSILLTHTLSLSLFRISITVVALIHPWKQQQGEDPFRNYLFYYPHHTGGGAQLLSGASEQEEQDQEQQKSGYGMRLLNFEGRSFCSNSLKFYVIEEQHGNESGDHHSGDGDVVKDLREGRGPGSRQGRHGRENSNGSVTN
jgi:hypothetical protein